MEGDELDLVKEFEPDPDIGAVIIGFDKYFSYPKLLKATTYLADPNVHFIGTNCDTDRPSPNTNKYPGNIIIYMFYSFLYVQDKRSIMLFSYLYR